MRVRLPLSGGWDVPDRDARPTDPALGPHRVRFFDDIIQAFKNAGRSGPQTPIRGLYGTLLVTFDGSPTSRAHTAAVARTYSAGGGRRDARHRVRGPVLLRVGEPVPRAWRRARTASSATTGPRARTSASSTGDVRARPTCGSRTSTAPTGQQLKQFFLGSVARPRSWRRTRSTSSTTSSTTRRSPSTVHDARDSRSRLTAADCYVSAYVVQLDNTTQGRLVLLLVRGVSGRLSG